ncbi:MAG TPA: PAS domain S-box protein [Thermoanaerobaculaceae bacterium]|nr:PAS domain S-box protein [Thermoanaerobaculaceae bacterium]
MGRDLPFERWSTLWAQALSIGAGALGLATLLGWTLRLDLLTRVAPMYVPIAPTTALAFAVLGGALVTSARWPRRQASRVVALVSVALVVSIVVWVNWGMAVGVVPTAPVAPGSVRHAILVPMSPVTSALLLSAAAALAVVAAGGERRVPLFAASLVCSGLVLASGIVISMGYLLAAPLLYGGAVVPVALPTGIAFVLIGAALMAGLQAAGSRLGRSVSAAVALSVGLAVSLGLFAVVELAESASTSPHLAWRGRAVLAGSVAFTWLLTLYVRARDRHHAQTESANRDLRAAEAKLRAIIESANDAIVTSDGRGVIVAWNRAAERIFGYTSDEAVGMAVSALAPERFRDAHTRGLTRAGDSDEFRVGGTTVEQAGLRKSGAEFPLELSIARWRAGEDVFFTAIMRDITDRRMAEELETAMFEIARASNESQSLHELLAAVHAGVRRLMDAANFYCALYEGESDTVWFPYFVDEFDVTPAPRKSCRGLTEFVIRTRAPQFVGTARFEALIRRGEVDSVGADSIDWLGVPLLTGGRVIGVLAVQSYAGGSRYGQRELDLLTFVSHEVAAAVERRQAQDELARSEARYRAVVEDQTEMICRFRPDGEVTFLNEAYVRYFGPARRSAVGKSVFDALPAPLAADMRTRIGSLTPADPVGTLRTEYETADRGKRTLAWTYHAIFGADGLPAEIQGVGRDITEQLALEAHLREAQRLEAVGVLAGGVAHEFNNDLQAMLATAQALRARRSDGAAFEVAMGRLEDVIKRAAGHTRQLLLFSQQSVSRPEPNDISEIVAGCEGLLASLVPAEVTLVLDVGGGRLAVEGDRGQLEQVLVNLVVNGADAMPRGGRLTVRTGSDGDGMAWLEVEDTGTGIPDDLRPRLFEPFFTTKRGGTGLGLAVTHGIVAGLGGRIEVSSQVDRGSRFRVVLPTLAVDETDSSDAGSPGRSVEPVGGRGERVLVVEDQPDARAGLVEALGLLGYRADGFGSGEDAIAAAEGGAYDLLLTDVKLPGIHGGALAEALGARWPELRVVLMSGYTEDVALRAAAAGGSARFLQKPFDMKTLAHEVRTALDEGG